MATISKPSLLPFAYEHIIKMTAKYIEFRKTYAANVDANDHENLLDIGKMWLLSNGIDSNLATEWLSRLAYLGLVVVGMTDAQHAIKTPAAKFGINFDGIPVMGCYLNSIPGGIEFIRKFWKLSPDFHGLKAMCIKDDYVIKTDGKLFVALMPKHMLCKIFEMDSFEEAYKTYATCAIGSFDDSAENEAEDMWPIIDISTIIKEIR